MIGAFVVMGLALVWIGAMLGTTVVLHRMGRGNP